MKKERVTLTKEIKKKQWQKPAMSILDIELTQSGTGSQKVETCWDVPWGTQCNNGSS